jgi:nitrogen-specific signal transduction histidine kinase
MEDMTDRRVLERQLRQAQRMEAVGQLTGGIAHDFNNILSIVIGNLDLLDEVLADRPSARRLAEAAMRGAARGADLVQRLLAFSRRQPLSPRAIDLGERLPSMASLLRRALGEHIAVETRPGTGLWPALADAAQLEDAILNLAINARDAMPKGGVLTIETANVSLDERYAATNADVTPGDYVMLAVSDTGTGMPPEVIEKVFEPFFTTKEIGKGSGLGLSMVYGFVKQLGGHVKIYSELGHGTSVKLYLPRAGADVEAAVAEDAAVADALPRGTERVLLVEDNPGVREAALETLGQLGYRVHAEDNGPAALAWLDRGEPVDLLFTDIVMPEGMNGRDLAKQALRRRPGLKVLFTTGYAEAAMQNGHKLEREALLIGKPYRKAELARMLRRAIDGNGNGNGNGNGGENGSHTVAPVDGRDAGRKP